MSERSYKEVREKRLYAMWFSIGIFTIIGIIVLWMAGMPRYRVWSQEMRGKAAFAEAVQNRQIQIEEAKANLESQKLNSEAEVERAKGMAQSIEIENGKLTPMYIHYLWVRNIDKMDGEKIYIPTEANLPLLEASRGK
jgi:hypothetical protein